MIERFNTDNIIYTNVVDKEKMFTVEISPENLDDNTQYHMFFIDKTKPLYMKRLTEATLSLQTEVLQGLSKNKEFKTPHLNSQGVNINFVYALQQLANFTGYFINSTSWGSQEMMDFDKAELKNRLEKVIRLL